MKNVLPLLTVVAAASLWGIIGIFVKGLTDAGLSAMEIVTVRVCCASLFLLAVGVIKNRNLLRIRVADIYLFIGTGIISIVFFNWCYFTAMNMLSISTAVILLYTSPVFVMIFSSLFFKEIITLPKILLIGCTVLGSILIAGVKGHALSGGDGIGFLIGLGSGLGYALYSIFGKLALKKYHTFTITAYTFFTASICLLPVTGIWRKAEQIMAPKTLMLIIGLGLFSTVIAYLLYTWGLGKMDGSRAAVLATIEPVTAMFLGFLFYGERLSVLQMAGAFVILGAVLYYNKMPGNKSGKAEKGHNQMV
ncbi:DMT family transporter [Peribacillus glennii]|uniref:EamA family transporter n=1 Tax=Peribacillus glennii TaxID=2303991 RepID=A0A372LGS1_9BACI|nr:EamA family transporter [Peribacillus glennii]RFU65495.1 EamA family transporter [Peribacillus glennii]